jgi:hypothetical protein
MRNIFWLSLIIMLLASSAFSSMAYYGFWTTCGPSSSGNQVNGTVVYDPDLDAVFVGQYFTTVNNRANILGWSVNQSDPTFGTSTPKYYIRERMYNNGMKLGGLKSVFGAASYLKGKLYFTSDRWGYTDLNMRPRLWCPVNADSVTITFPYVTPNLPLYIVNGISSTASTPLEDTWGGTQLFASAGTTFTLISTTCETDGYRVIIPGNQFLAGIAGVWTNNDTTALGTNFFTGGEVNGPTRTAWCNTFIPGSPRMVYVTGTVQRFQPQTGIIELVAPHPPGQLLFVDAGQLQPGQRGLWKYNATTLAAETGFGIFGTPVMFEPCTVANIITSGGVTTGLDIGVPGSKITDNFLVTREIGTNNPRGRLGYASFGRFTTGPWVSTSATMFTMDVQGKPYYTIYGIYTSANCVGMNFWGRRTFNDWIAVTDTTKVVVPWGPISRPYSLATAGTTSYTRESNYSVSSITIQTIKSPITTVSGVWPNAYGSGKNYAAAANYTRESTSSSNATTINLTWTPLNSVSGVWTNSSGAGFNFYSEPGNSFNNNGLITLNSITTLGGSGVPVWVTYNGGTTATVTLPNTVTLNGVPLPGGAGTPVWISYTIPKLDSGGTITPSGTNFYTGLTYGIETLSVKSGSGGFGGWWNVSLDTPTIYASISGINTTLSLGSVFVSYDSEPPDAYTPGRYNPMDTTGIINLQIPLPGPGTSVWIDFDRGNGIDVGKNMVRTIAPAANTPPMHVGDTVYISMLAQGGANPYKYSGSGTAGNRTATWNLYGVTFDKDGNFFICSLWSDKGFFAHDSVGNLIARYPVKGSRSTISRGAISCDTATGDIYWGDQAGVVWRFKKTGAGLDSYVQEEEPFYLGACLGTNNTVLRGMVTSLKVVTGPPFSDEGHWIGPYTQIYLTTPMDNNGPTSGTDIITIMRPNGTVNTRGSYNSTNAPTPRGIDIKYYWPAYPIVVRGQIMTGSWAGTGSFPQVFLWDGSVPVELSRFEAVVE